MIAVILQFGGDLILIRVRGNRVTFANTMYGAQEAPISGLKLSKKGVEREFPDLIDHPYWESEACERFKDKIRKLKGEEKKVQYIIHDLKKHGYIPKRIEQSGRRPRKI